MADEQNTELTQEQKDQQAAERFRAQQNGPAKEAPLTVERPEHIPEKFWDAEKGEVNVEAMAKSYLELEKLKGKADDKPEDDKKPDDKKADESTDDDPKAAFAKLREETSQAIVEKGAPTEEQYAAYEKLGFSKQDVDEFAEFQKWKGEQAGETLFKEAGGQEQYAAMVEWAKDAFTADEIAVYNRTVVEGNDQAARLVAIRGLRARYEAAVGREGRSVTTQGGAQGGPAGYTSKAQMIADMRDPRYTKDEGFRREVAQKINAARKAGVELS